VLGFDFTDACKIVTAEHEAGSQRVRTEHVGKKLDERRPNPLELARKLVDSRPLGRIGFVRQLSEAPLGKALIERAKGSSKPLGLGLDKDVAGN
jgi:hypothetical protein